MLSISGLRTAVATASARPANLSLEPSSAGRANELDANPLVKLAPDGPRSIIIRTDSSASYGDETVRWRLQGDSIHIAFGDEWMVYHYNLKGSRLTLSGGDLEDPISLKRTGPATPRPTGVDVPPAPPDDRRGTASPVSNSKKTKPASPGR